MTDHLLLDAHKKNLVGVTIAKGSDPSAITEAREHLNPFAAHGERHRLRRHRMPPSPAVAERRSEQTTLSKAYHAARRQWFDRVLDCPEGPRVRAMVAWIKTLGPDDADELVEVVTGEDWLLAAPQEVRFAALQLIGEQICRIRREAGLLEFDDPLPDEPENAFQIIRRLLNP